jgi:hypothetical protein
MEILKENTVSYRKWMRNGSVLEDGRPIKKLRARVGIQNNSKRRHRVLNHENRHPRRVTPLTRKSPRRHSCQSALSDPLFKRIAFFSKNSPLSLFKPF